MQCLIRTLEDCAANCCERVGEPAGLPSRRPPPGCSRLRATPTPGAIRSEPFERNDRFGKLVVLELKVRKYPVNIHHRSPSESKRAAAIQRSVVSAPDIQHNSPAATSATRRDVISHNPVIWGPTQGLQLREPTRSYHIRPWAIVYPRRSQVSSISCLGRGPRGLKPWLTDAVLDLSSVHAGRRSTSRKGQAR
jgi:hypothetical protein